MAVPLFRLLLVLLVGSPFGGGEIEKSLPNDEPLELHQVAITLKILGEKIVKLHQLEAPTWHDPGWEIETTGLDIIKEPYVHAKVHYPRSFQKGDPGYYVLHYDVVSFQDSEIPSDAIVRGDTREIHVRPVDWCKYLTGECDDLSEAKCHSEFVQCESDNCPETLDRCFSDMGECTAIHQTKIDRSFDPRVSECVNLGDGKYKIQCRSGFEPSNLQAYELYGEGKVLNYRPKCVNVNECEVFLNSCVGDSISNGSVECVDTFGSYACKCKRGYEEIEPRQNVQDPPNCSLINECAPGTVGDLHCRELSCPAICIQIDYDPKLQRAFRCACDNSKGCFDEKSDGLSCVARCEKSFVRLCGPNSFCKIFNGMPTCFEDFNECENEIDQCDHQSTICRNLIGTAISPLGYYCECKEGFTRISQFRCEDIDECEEKTDLCDPETEICVNQIGFSDVAPSGYICECQLDYKLEDGHCVSPEDIHFSLKPGDNDPHSVTQCELYRDPGWILNGSHSDDVDVIVTLPVELSRSSVRNIRSITNPFLIRYSIVSQEKKVLRTLARKVAVHKVNRCNPDSKCPVIPPTNAHCANIPESEFDGGLEYRFVCHEPRVCRGLSPEDLSEFPDLQKKSLEFLDFLNKMKNSGFTDSSEFPQRCVKKQIDTPLIVKCRDNSPPVIFLKGGLDVVVDECRVCDRLSKSPFNEEIYGGFMAYDFFDGPVKVTTQKKERKNIENETIYEIVYLAEDSNGYQANISRFWRYQINDISMSVRELISFQQQMSQLFFKVLVGMTTLLVGVGTVFLFSRLKFAPQV